MTKPPADAAPPIAAPPIAAPPYGAPPAALRMAADLHIPADHAAFSGHFPGFPILPGAALLDAALHEIVRTRQLDLTRWRLATVKFLGLVRPGDALTLEHSAADAAIVRFTVRNPGGAVATGTLAGSDPASASGDCHGA